MSWVIVLLVRLLGLGPPSAAATCDPEAGADYLMLAPPEAHATLAPLVHAHTRRGLRVAVCPSESSVDGIAAQIARFAPPTPKGTAAAPPPDSPASDRPALRFVLLVGDDWSASPATVTPSEGVPEPKPTVSEAPVGEVRTSEAFRLPAMRRPKVAYDGLPDSEDYPTDLPYAPPGVAIGRFPVRDLETLEGLVKKTVAYLDGPGGGWQRRLALFGGPANFSPFVDSLIESEVQRLLGESVPYLYDLRFVFAKPDSPYTWRPDGLSEKIAEELAPGALFAAYFGHGLPRALDLIWFRDQPYNIGDTESLARVRIPQGKPVTFLLACHTGAFDDPVGDPSLAETLFLNPEGPIAVIASSRTSHPYGNAVMARALTDVFLEHRAPTVGQGLRLVHKRLGFHRMGLVEVLVRPSIRELLDEHAHLYALFGDPALPIRYPTPVAVSVRAADADPGAGSIKQARPGEPLTVTVADGEALVTLETDRRVVRPPLLPLDSADLAEVFDAMTKNHARAIDKVVAELGGGADRTFEAPSAPGRYVVKVLHPGSNAGAGFTTFEVVAPSTSTTTTTTATAR